MGRLIHDNITVVVPRLEAGGEPRAGPDRGPAGGRGPRHPAHLRHQNRDTAHQGNCHQTEAKLIHSYLVVKINT